MPAILSELFGLYILTEDVLYQMSGKFPLTVYFMLTRKSRTVSAGESQGISSYTRTEVSNPVSE